jgi:hypothetical protein
VITISHESADINIHESLDIKLSNIHWQFTIRVQVLQKNKGGFQTKMTLNMDLMGTLEFKLHMSGISARIGRTSQHLMSDGP